MRTSSYPAGAIRPESLWVQPEGIEPYGVGRESSSCACLSEMLVIFSPVGVFDGFVVRPILSFCFLALSEPSCAILRPSFGVSELFALSMVSPSSSQLGNNCGACIAEDSEGNACFLGRDCDPED